MISERIGSGNILMIYIDVEYTVQTIIAYSTTGIGHFNVINHIKQVNTIKENQTVTEKRKILLEIIAYNRKASLDAYVVQ